jgi:hypothetical protein
VDHAPGAVPNVKPGQWILDATVNTTGRLLRHANFYQVVTVIHNPPDPATAVQTWIEVQSPIKTSDGASLQYSGTLVVLDGVAGVYPRFVLPARPGP